MDEADKAQDHMEREAGFVLAASRKPAGPLARGFCNWCNCVVTRGLTFCDSSCRDDYDTDQRLALIRGRA